MQKKALVIIDIQNGITKNYKEIIDHINKSIEWATKQDIHVVYIRHENLSAGTRTFKPNTCGAELAPDLNIVSKNTFIKTKGNIDLLVSKPVNLHISRIYMMKGGSPFFVDLLG